MAALLQLHSRGAEVVRLQTLLNSRVVPSPKLATDGVFGPRTRAAVERFQRASWLSEDGRVGPCTWSALERRDRYLVLHQLTLVPQWTASTCWHAALTMLLGHSVQVPSFVDASPVDGLENDSGLLGARNTATLAAVFGLTLVHAQSLLPAVLAQLARVHGLLMMDLLWSAAGYLSGAGSPGHMVIVAGVRGDGTAEGTTLRIYDPWPPNRGSIYSLSYGPFLSRMPMGAYQLYYR